MDGKATGEGGLKFIKTVAGIVMPVVIIILATGALLRMLNRLPEYIQPIQENLVYYQNIEQAEEDLGINILAPSYFPDYLVWPPSSIRAERKPRLKVVLRFVKRGSGQPALIIEQSFVKGGEAFKMVIPPRPWLKKEILVNGSPGEMLSWIDEEGFRWHRASWVRRGRRFDARSVLPEEEFLRIVNSIHR